MPRYRARFVFAALMLVLCGGMVAQDATVRGRVEVIHHSRRESGNSEVVVWLVGPHAIAASSISQNMKLLQKNKRFAPHVVAVQVGAEIDFPNQDPFFHDVFSIYRGKPFDLGLYEAGTSRKVKFTQPGVSYIFCNIHPQMSAAVIALPTPYFAVTSSDGSFQISHVPPGHYKLDVWYELAPESELTPQSREVDVVLGDNHLDAIKIHSSDTLPEHLNKYGQQYLEEKPKSY